MSSPAKRARKLSTLEELVVVVAELEHVDRKREELATRRDELILRARDEDPEVSQRDIAAYGKVTHAWVRKLELRAEGDRVATAAGG